MKKFFHLICLVLLTLVSQSGLAQTLTNNPQIICMGETRPYRVDWQAPDGPDGTVGSTYAWSVITAGFVGTITPNQSPGGFNNHILINWGATPAGTYTVQVIETNNGCASAPVTLDVQLLPLVTPVTGFTYTTPVCANNANLLPTPDVGFTAGGTYSSTAGLVINGSTGEIDVASSTPGTYVITYSVTATGCQLAGSSTFSVTINNTITPVTGFTYTTPVCANNANLLPTPDVGFTAGGTYSSTAGLVINGSTGEIDVASSTPGTYVITYSVTATGCQLAGSSTFSVTINNTITPVTGFTYTTPVCANNANLLPTPDVGFTAGGTYSSTAGLVINGSTGEIDVASSTPGTYVITYSVTATGCQLAGSSTFSVTINNTITPVTGFTYTTPVCANNANLLPTPDVGFTAGGTYSSTAGLVINGSTGEIDVASSTPGTYVITYSVTATGCQLAGSSTFSVTINNTITPVTGFTYTTPVCANNANLLPTPDVGFTAGGTYSSTAGLVINGSTGEIDVASSTPGTYVITYSVTATGCQLAGSSTFSVTINNTITPVTGFTYTTPVCANNANLLPTPDVGFTAGGTYSSTAGLVINGSTGEIDVASSTPGTYVITYSVTATGCQLAGSSTFSVTINNTITPVTGFTYTTPVCANNANLLPTPDVGFTAGGTYSSTAGLVINGSTGEIDVASSTPGTYVITYSVTATGCQLAGSSTFSVTINNTITPVTGFTYTTPVCANNANLLPTPDVGFTAGGTYSSTAGLVINGSTGEIDVASSTPGTYVITYSVTATGCQLAGSSTFSVTINNTITPVTGFTYTTPVCANNANLLPTPDVGFTAGGTYSSTAGLVINGSTGEIDVASSTPGTYVITYSVTATGCQLAGSSTFSVTINNTITPVTGFTYTTPVCANNANLLPTPDVGFTAGGTYSSTAGLVINGSTGEIDVASSTPGTYVITYSVTATGCQLAGSSTFSVTITPLPTTSLIFHD